MPRLQTVVLQPTVTYRRRPVDDKASWPMAVASSARLGPVTAPMPVPSGLYAGVGRDAGHAPTPIRTVMNFAIAEWTSIIGPFSLAKIPSAMVVNTPRGNMNPLRERVNIDRPDARSLGSTVSLDQQNLGGGNLGKLAFRI